MRNMRFRAALLLSVFALSLCLNGNQEALAKSKKPANGTQKTHIVGALEKSEDVQSIFELISGLMNASNAHNMEEVLHYYSPRFVSGDNLSLDQVQHLIEETWSIYPDINYTTNTLEIRVNGDWATVESLDFAEAGAKANPDVSGAPGKLQSRSRGLIFLHRMGRTWQIVSDYTVYETATITYGNMSTVTPVLSTPDQVFAGEPYTAKLDIELTEGSIGIATIAKDPLVYPQKTPKDKFRPMSQAQNTLERVFDANTTNNNEIVVATIGLTAVSHSEQDHPSVELQGVTTIVKRVNVIPRSTHATAADQSQVVRHSASGLINLAARAAQAATDTDDDAAE